MLDVVDTSIVQCGSHVVLGHLCAVLKMPRTEIGAKWHVVLASSDIRPSRIHNASRIGHAHAGQIVVRLVVMSRRLVVFWCRRLDFEAACFRGAVVKKPASTGKGPGGMVRGFSAGTTRRFEMLLL